MDDRSILKLAMEMDKRIKKGGTSGWSPSMNVGYVDQLNAARRDTMSMSYVLAQMNKIDKSGYSPVNEFPRWLRIKLWELAIRLHTGDYESCHHRPRVVAPQPMVMALWNPRRVVCMSCAPSVQCEPASEEDRTCDGCRRVTAGLAFGDGIRPSSVTFVHVLVLHGVCDPCHVAFPS